MNDLPAPDPASPRRSAHDAWGGAIPRAPRGCVFYAFGDAYMLRLLVAIHSLRRVYSGPVAVVLAGRGPEEAPAADLRQLGCEIVCVDRLSQSQHRDGIFLGSPYDATLSLDADMVFRAPIDELWDPLEQTGLLVTRFHPEPYGVGGSRQARGWGDRVGMLAAVRGLLGDALHAAAQRRLVDDGVDVNIGVFGIAKPRGDAFLADFAERMERGRGTRAPLLDEMLVVGLLPAHRHHLAAERWNCPADGFFRRTQLEEAAVVHYFADGHAVGGTHLGRNPLTPAGRIWLEAARAASRDMDLTRWTRADRQLAEHFARSKAAGRAGAHPAAHGAATTRPAVPPEAGQDRSGASVVLLSYRRPQNLDRILGALRDCEFVKEIILSNNNPEVRMADHLHVADERLQVIDQTERAYPALRFELSRKAKCHWLIAIDDDVFPTADQIRALYDALRTEPGMPHGFGGQIFRPGTPPRITAIENRNLPVESLVWIFAYSQDHVRRYFELLAAAGLDTATLRFNEDVPLSFAGSRPARAHYVGPIAFCETATAQGIASHTASGFMRQRFELVAKMRELTGRPAPGGRQGAPARRGVDVRQPSRDER